MTDLAIRDQQLPERIEDIAKFLLIAPVKLAAVKAEIRAIRNVGLARDVYEQKKLEERALAELILDAKAKVGEFTKALPVAPGVRTDIKPSSSTDTRFTQKPKEDAIKELGFSKAQVQRMETLADNKDLIEQVKAEARENNTFPTSTRIIDLARERKSRSDAELQRDLKKIDQNYDNLKKFRRAISNPELYGILDHEEIILPAVVSADSNFTDTIADIDRYITVLTVIKNKLILLKGGYNA